MSQQKTGQPASPQPAGPIVSLRDPPSKDKLGPPTRASAVPPLAQDYPSSSPAPYQSHHPSHTSVPPLVPPGPASSGSSSSSSSFSAQVPSLPPAPGPSYRPPEGETPTLTCQQCSKQFSMKPLLLSHQVRSTEPTQQLSISS